MKPGQLFSPLPQKVFPMKLLTSLAGRCNMHQAAQPELNQLPAV
jgi:hypothetical protein